MRQTFLILFIALSNFSGYSQNSISVKEQKEITQQILKMENAWTQTLMSGNFSILNKILADDYQGSDHVSRRTKSEEIKSYKDNKLKINSAIIEKVKVNVFATNVALVTGELKIKGVDETGNSVDVGYRFSDTYIKRNNLWQCVSAHASEMKN